MNVKKIIDDIEFLSNEYHNRYSNNNRVMVARRWHAYKFILLGIHNEAENRIALELVERLMHVSNSKHENEKDTYLLNELVKIVMRFEKKAYPSYKRLKVK